MQIKDKQVENKANQEKSLQQINMQSLLSEYYPNSLLQNSKSNIKKNKSKSVASLPSILRNPLTVEGSLNKRYNRHQGGLKKQIDELEKQCDKFGGSEHIKDQMKKQKITREQELQYYEKRIKKLNSNKSLPKLLQFKQLQGYSKLKLFTQQRVKQFQRSKQKQIIPYNKWYMKPKQRFSKIQSSLSGNKRGRSIEEKDYLNELLLKNKTKKNVKIKGQFAPIIIKESVKKLGRQPIICSYAKISRM